MLPDIQNKNDIEQLMQLFYDQLLVDEVLGTIFTDIAKIDLNHHLPILVNFWDAVLFETGGYSNNAVGKHVELNRKVPLTDLHFDRWMHIFETTIDQNFQGKIAEKAKEKAKLMRMLMQYKIKASEEEGFIQ